MFDLLLKTNSIHADYQYREWLWHLPYTLLEIQAKPGAAIRPLESRGEGVQHLQLRQVEQSQHQHQ